MQCEMYLDVWDHVYVIGLDGHISIFLSYLLKQIYSRPVLIMLGFKVGDMKRMYLSNFTRSCGERNQKKKTSHNLLFALRMPGWKWIEFHQVANKSEACGAKWKRVKPLFQLCTYCIVWHQSCTSISKEIQLSAVLAWNVEASWCFSVSKENYPTSKWRWKSDTTEYWAEYW